MSGMSFQDFASLVMYISKNNSPMLPNSNSKAPTVKYIDPVFDMRTNSVFCVKLRGFGGGQVVFYSTNEYRDHPMILKERVLKYLQTGEIMPSATLPTLGRIPLAAAEADAEKGCINCDHRMTDFKADPCSNCRGVSNWKPYDYSTKDKS